MTTLCRDCLYLYTTNCRCPSCGSQRIISHAELSQLKIAHMDCDAFYASVEKRDNPALADKPVIIGGGKRGVVSTACYIARIRGVRSAMPMFKAIKLCPDAVVIKPRMNVYVETSYAIRRLMDELTPNIEPLSLDEAFLDLSGTERLHGAPPAVMLAKLINRIQTELGITGSIGLSYNKFLAKIASDFDKPNGFFVIGKEETSAFLHDKPVKFIWGVGKSTQTALEKAGIRTFSDLWRWEKIELVSRFGLIGDRLWHLSRGEDVRRVSNRELTKSISNEITFNKDTNDISVLDGHLWRLAEKVSDRAKAKQLAGRIITLKVKRSNHSLLTRQVALRDPTQLADMIYRQARTLLDQLDEKPALRLIGCGLSQLCSLDQIDVSTDLFDHELSKTISTEQTTDKIRQKFGPKAIMKGRSFR
ncbi:MAG: DNA polymerase IV [Aestuariivita sp.]|nr:DNA polymerase IV [Aestuariivita sp.]